MSGFDFFQQSFPKLEKNFVNPHVIVSELAYYNEKGIVEITDIFKNEFFYDLLNPHRVHLYHYLKTDSFSPISLELTINSKKGLNLRIASGLGIWFPYIKPDIDSNKQSLDDFPINENGLIDNRELYLLNTPRMLGFIKEVRSFYNLHEGQEIGNNAELEKLPEFN